MDTFSIYYNARPTTRISAENWEYLFTILGKHFHYTRTDVTYPHGDAKSIHPNRINADGTLFCDIVFADYYMAEYCFSINDGTAIMFKNLKQY